MSTETKIGKLRSALLNGEKTSPLRAWLEWKIAFNTYHNALWRLAHRDNIPIQSEMVGDRDGVQHSVHWIDPEYFKKVA